MTTLKFSNLHPWDGCNLPDQSFHQRFMRVTYKWRKTVHKIISQMWKRWDDWPRPVQCLTIAVHILWLPSALVHSSITDESMTPYWAISSSNPVFLVVTPNKKQSLSWVSHARSLKLHYIPHIRSAAKFLYFYEIQCSNFCQPKTRIVKDIVRVWNIFLIGYPKKYIMKISTQTYISVRIVKFH